MSLIPFSLELDSVFHKFDAAAIGLMTGGTLGMKYERLADIGSLDTVLKTCTRYFKPQVGDVLVLNDPYSGGHLLSAMFFVAPVFPNLALVVKMELKPNLSLKSHMDEEGLRIPPTPIVQNGLIQKDLIDAIQTHPKAQLDWKPRVEKTLQDLLHVVGVLQKFPKKVKRWEDSLGPSEQRLNHTLSEFPHGEAKIEKKFPTGELLKLHLAVEKTGLSLDFSGSSKAVMMGIPEHVVYGASAGAFAAFLNWKESLNSKFLDAVQVASPAGSFLHVKYPMPTFRGCTQGVEWVADSVLEGLSKLAPKHLNFKDHRSSVTETQQMLITFGDSRRCYFQFPAQVGKWSMWNRSRLRNSAQEIEKLYPIRWLSTDSKNRELHVLEDAQLQFLTGPGFRLEQQSPDGKIEVLNPMKGVANVMANSKIRLIKE